MAAVNRIAVLRGINRLVSVARPVGARSNSGSTLSFGSKQVTPSPQAQRSSSSSSNDVGPRPQMALRREGSVQLSGCRLYSDDSAMTVSELEERVLNVLKMFDKINPDKVNLTAHFVNDLGLDSLDVVEIVMAFEDEFGIEIDDEQAEKLFTASDAVAFLKLNLDDFQ